MPGLRLDTEEPRRLPWGWIIVLAVVAINLPALYFALPAMIRAWAGVAP